MISCVDAAKRTPKKIQGNYAVIRAWVAGEAPAQSALENSDMTIHPINQVLRYQGVSIAYVCLRGNRAVLPYALPTQAHQRWADVVSFELGKRKADT